jgi:hypothetical protein
MVTDYYKEKWPSPVIPFDPWTPTPGEPLIPFNEDDPFRIRLITESEWKEYQELKRRAAEYDARTNQPDCVKPDVAEWENDIEAFLILMGLLTEEDMWSQDFRAGVGG